MVSKKKIDRMTKEFPIPDMGITRSDILAYYEGHDDYHTMKKIVTKLSDEAMRDLATDISNDLLTETHYWSVLDTHAKVLFKKHKLLR